MRSTHTQLSGRSKSITEAVDFRGKYEVVVRAGKKQGFASAGSMALVNYARNAGTCFYRTSDLPVVYETKYSPRPNRREDAATSPHSLSDWLNVWLQGCLSQDFDDIGSQGDGRCANQTNEPESSSIGCRIRVANVLSICRDAFFL